MSLGTVPPGEREIELHVEITQTPDARTFSRHEELW